MVRPSHPPMGVTPMALGLGIVAFIVVVLLYWLLITTEGTYLGAKIVALLYDWAAARYDRVKDVHFVNEARFLSLPLLEALGGAPSPWVLDVATGTGRLPKALLGQPDFQGAVLGIDRSVGMMRQAQASLQEYDRRALLIQADADRLPFAEGSFSVVTCLEALEFMVHPQAVLREVVRVLKPGGVLLLSNRVGPDARFFPGRLCGRGRLERRLQDLGLQGVRMERWQVHYDLVWACKPTAHRGQV